MHCVMPRNVFPDHFPDAPADFFPDSPSVFPDVPSIAPYEPRDFFPSHMTWHPMPRSPGMSNLFERTVKN